jgi:hypothetical protein
MKRGADGFIVLPHPVGELCCGPHNKLQHQTSQKEPVCHCLLCLPQKYLSGSISNFGIFKHPKHGHSDSSSTLQPPSTAKSDDSASTAKRPTTARQRSNEGDCIERLHAAGLLDVYWHGKCEADKVATGTYKVKGAGGMYALVDFF